MNREFPAADDDLFDLGANWHHNASLHMTHDMWVIYAEGYKQAADKLVEQVQSGNTSNNFVVYPVIFLYRHFVELRLKEILKDGYQAAGKRAPVPSKHPLNEHPLMPLWKECRRIVEEVWPKDEPIPLDSAERIIGQLEKHDASSFAFRYPSDKKGQPMLRDLTHVNLVKFSQVIGRLANLLNTLSCGIAQLLGEEIGGC